jgi:LysM repeat protein
MMILNDELLQNVSGGTQIPYIVMPGDTAEAIAKKFRCTVEQLCRWNNIRNPQEIKVGQKLMIRF